MSNDLIAFPTGGGMQVNALLQGLGLGEELSENIGGTFAVLSMKGKVFGVKYGGDTKQLLVEYQGSQYAAPCIDVVLVKGNPNLSKTYYKDGYVEGSNESPDCWSEDGHTPLAPTPICTSCDVCPMNQFGSRLNAATGSKGKACSDTRKVAFLFANDLAGAEYKGPILARITASNLKDLAEYQKELSRQGIPYQAVVTRITFDTDEAFPKFVFKAIRMVTDDEAKVIVNWVKDARTEEVLKSGQASAPATQALPAAVIQQPVPTAFAEQQPPVQHNNAPQQVASPAPVAAAPVSHTVPTPPVPVSNVVPMVPPAAVAPPPPPAAAMAPVTMPVAAPPPTMGMPPAPQTFAQPTPVPSGVPVNQVVPQPGPAALQAGLMADLDSLLDR